MSSGMGVRGTSGRCYGFFQDFLSCEAEIRKRLLGRDDCKVKDGPIRPCYEEREDYFECIHTKKEQAQAKLVLDEKKRQGID